MATEDEAGNGNDLVGFLTKVLPLMAALLPAAGVGVRWIAFSLEDLHPAGELAASQALPSQALAGFRALAPVVPVFVLAVPILRSVEPFFNALGGARRGSRELLGDLEARAARHPSVWKLRHLRKRLNRHPLGVSRYLLEMLVAIGAEIAPGDREWRQRVTRLISTVDEASPPWGRASSSRVVRRLGNAGYALFFASALVLLPDWPTSGIILLSLGVATAVMMRSLLREQRLRLLTSWSAAVIIIAGATLSAGLHLDSPVSGYVTFSEKTALESGHYIEIAEWKEGLWLYSCSTDEVVRAPVRLIENVRYPTVRVTHNPEPSLYTLLATSRGLETGINLRCLPGLAPATS